MIDYHYIRALGIPVADDPVEHCPWPKLNTRLRRLGILRAFDAAFGEGHTVIHEGPFCCDVERALRVLQRKGLLRVK